MGTKTFLFLPLKNRYYQSEKRIPKHGDENDDGRPYKLGESVR